MEGFKTLQGEGSFLAVLSHFPRFRHRNKNTEARVEDEGQHPKNNLIEKEAMEVQLWNKCCSLCLVTHPETETCFTLGDFNVFMCPRPHSFVVGECGAFDLFNKLFGKQEFFALSERHGGREKPVPAIKLTCEQSTAGSSALKRKRELVSDQFISHVTNYVSSFLEVDFPDPLTSIKHKTPKSIEVYTAIKRYKTRVDSACLSIPTFLLILKSSSEIIEELMTHQVSDISLFLDDDFKKNIIQVSKTFQYLLRQVRLYWLVMQSGSRIIQTLSSWAIHEHSLQEVHGRMILRHTRLIESQFFKNLPSIEEMCKEYCHSSRSMSVLVRELEDISLSISENKLSEDYSLTENSRTSSEKALVVDLSGEYFSSEEPLG